jgi:hypothetical protein
MSMTSGTKLGPYEIVALIGAAGMGEVYRAGDTQLEPAKQKHTVVFVENFFDEITPPVAAQPSVIWHDKFAHRGPGPV